jgi:hypothetical protein
MISYNDFTNFKETNYNFSVCEDWGWFHVDEEDPFLQNTNIHLHYASPIPLQQHPIKSILKRIAPVANSIIQTPPNVVQKMPHAHLMVDNVYIPGFNYKNNNWCPASSFNAIKNGLVVGVVLMIYIFSK